MSGTSRGWARVCLAATSLALALAGGCGDDGGGSAVETESGSTSSGGDETAGPATTGASSDGGDSTATTGETGGPDARFDPLIDAVDAYMDEAQIPGAALAVIEGGEVTFARGFGVKHPDEDDPVLPTSLFRFASVLKMMTATALLQQVDAGAVELDAPITTYLPGFTFAQDPTWAPSITVRHLLTHQSAMKDVFLINGPPGPEALAQWVYDDWSQLGFLWTPPGKMWNYSNAGYILAGLVAEEAAGIPYPTYVEDEVWAPLGMDRTFFLPSEVLADGDYVHGVTHVGAGQRVVYAPDAYDSGSARPAGMAFTNVYDLARFVGFLRDGDAGVLSDATRAEMMTAQVDLDIEPGYSGYGYGLQVMQGYLLDRDQPGRERFFDIPWVFHTGGVAGYSADLVYFPSLDLGFAWLANTDDVRFLGPLLDVAVDTLAALPPDVEPPSWTIDPATYLLYEGTYDEPHGVIGSMVVTANGDELRVSLPRMDLLGISYDPALEPFSVHSFLFTIAGVPVVVTFIFDDVETATYVRTREWVVTRTDPAQVPPPVDTAAQRASVDALLERLRHAPPPPPRSHLVRVGPD